MKQKSVLILTKPMSHVRLGGIARFARSRHFRHAVWFSTIWSHSHALRFKGFADAWQTAVGTQPERWVLSERLSEREFDNWKVFTRRLATLLRKAPKPLAVLGYDDADAARVLTACLSWLTRTRGASTDRASTLRCSPPSAGCRA